jgi:hypothetical protein
LPEARPCALPGLCRRLRLTARGEIETSGVYELYRRSLIVPTRTTAARVTPSRLVHAAFRGAWRTRRS